ncbi:MAG TPA: DUF2490 domain-containing protein [Prolixibacteraceae bacterium]|nr:DUF2490 domain-containing protein [Prolixibacteraceae bacterium]
MTKNLTWATMIKRNHYFILFLIVWAISNKGVAQTTDFRLRAGISVEKELSKKMAVAVGYEHRSYNHFTLFQELVEPSVSYEVIKPLTIGAEWRIMADQNLKRRVSYKQRGAISLRYKKEIGDFDLKIKTAIQYGFDDLTNTSGNFNKLINRNSVSIDYTIYKSKFAPFASYEFFYYLNDPHGGIINQSRLRAGTSYRLSKAAEISAYYLFENEFNVADPVDSHIVGFSFGYKF